MLATQAKWLAENTINTVEVAIKVLSNGFSDFGASCPHRTPAGFVNFDMYNGVRIPGCPLCGNRQGAKQARPVIGRYLNRFVGSWFCPPAQDQVRVLQLQDQLDRTVDRLVRV